MGVVFRASEPGLGRRVALKLILPERARDERFRRLFAEESRRAAALEHPNVIPIYRSGEEDGVLYIAMRFVDGPNLGQLVARRGRLPVGAAVRIVSQIADALDAAHAAGLVHRDVKPANILLADAAGEEHAYLTDFGLAVPITDGMARRGRYAGTLSYISPEQIRGGALDGRADVYALGGVLFHALTGRVPFPVSGREAKLVAHLPHRRRGPRTWCRACRAPSTTSSPARWPSVPRIATRRRASWRRRPARRARTSCCATTPTTTTRPARWPSA